MSKEHKHHNSRIEITTSLAADRALDIAGQTVFTQSNLEIVGLNADEGLFAAQVKSWGTVQLSFIVNTETDEGLTRLSSDILEYRTAQERLFYFIPIGPTTMLGYKDYKRYMNALARTINAADPSARTQIIEQEGSGA